MVNNNLIGSIAIPTTYDFSKFLNFTLVPKLRDELDNRGHDEIHVIVGGVIPKEDFSTLIDIGASAIFATGTNIINSAMEMLQIIESSNS